MPSVLLWPSMSSVADSRSVEISVTPSTGFWPTEITRGAPPSITTTALPGNRPITFTSTVQPVEDNRKSSDATIRSLTRSEEHTSELQSLTNLVCRLLLEKKKKRDE